MNTTTSVRAGNGGRLDPSGGDRGAQIDPNG
jgi:hypothetical protein